MQSVGHNHGLMSVCGAVRSTQVLNKEVDCGRGARACTEKITIAMRALPLREFSFTICTKQIGFRHYCSTCTNMNDAVQFVARYIIVQRMLAWCILHDLDTQYSPAVKVYNTGCYSCTALQCTHDAGRGVIVPVLWQCSLLYNTDTQHSFGGVREDTGRWVGRPRDACRCERCGAAENDDACHMALRCTVRAK